MKPLRLLPIFLLIFLIIPAARADKETLTKGWEAFNTNQRDQAKSLFEKAALDTDTKAQANLALSLLYWGSDKSKESFAAFSEFMKASDNPYPYLYALWTSPPVFDSYGKKDKSQTDLLKELMTDPKANGTIQAMAHAILGGNYEYAGDFKKMETEYSQIGSIEKWQVLGTFDNTSASGFNKDFGALQKPKTSDTFKNKVGADVTWFTPPYFRSDRWFDFAYYFSIDYSVMYAQTFLKSDIDQDVYFRSGNSGSLKIWVNDKIVTNVPEERNCDLDIYINNVKLHKGYNRVLVQVGESETGRANFMIRVTDKDGNPIQGLSESPSYQEYAPASDYKVNSSPLFAEAFFEKKLKEDSTDLVNYLMLSEVYLRNDKVYEARKVLKKAKALAPQSTFLGTRMIEAYARDNNRTDLTKEYEKIKANDPNSVYAIQGRIAEAADREDYDEQEKLIDKYESLYGKDLYSELQRLNLASSRKKYDVVISQAQQLYKQYPDNYDLMSLVYNIERNSSKDLAKANQILKAYLKNNYNDKVITTIASNDFDLGNKKEGINLYLQRVQNYPYGIGFYNDLSDLYFGSQDYPKALEWINKTLEFAPYIGTYWNKKGKIYMAMNKNSEAKNAFSKAIYYTPTDYEARKLLRKLEGQKDLFENFKTVDAYALYKQSPSSDSFPDDNSIILLNDIQRVVYPEGATEDRTEILVKVFNKNGIDTWKEYSIGYNSYRQRLLIDKAEVLKKDGNKVQAEKRSGYIVFTNLEAGDAIHLSYRIENYNTGKLAQHFWDQFNFNFDYPVQISRYSLLLPANKKFKYEVLNADIKPEIKEVEGMKLYSWEMKDQPSIKIEPYMPGLSDVGAILDLSTIPDWKYVSNWYSDLSSELAKTDFEIAETVTDLFKGTHDLSDLQKAKMIYNFIEENVSYSDVPFMHGPIIPQKASRTLNTKLGDCKDVSTLFVAMCKEAGIKANLVLVDTRDNGEHHLNLPSIDFNHCIAQLTTGGKTYFIELTDQQLSFASAPLVDLGANALIIPRDGDSASTHLIKLNFPNRPKNEVTRTTDLKFDNNDIIFSRKSLKTGYLASLMRSEFGEVGREKQEKIITQSISGDFTNSAKMLDLKFGDLQTLSDSVNYDYSFLVKNEVSEVVGIKIFRIPWSEGVRTLDFLTVEKRQYPFLLWYLNAEESNYEEMNIDLPKGKLLAEQPKSVSFSCKAADYSLTYTFPEPGKIKAIREMKFKEGIVPPEDYNEFKEFYHNVAEADSKQIGFK